MTTSIHNEGITALLPLGTVHAFPVNTFIENLAVRPSGELLLTVHNKNELLRLDPNSADPTPDTIHVFPAGVCGIVEVEDDTFYVSCGTIGEKGSWAVYKVDMSAAPPKISKHIDIPDALFLNGSALLNSEKGTILLADSILGAVFCANVHEQTVKLWLQHAKLAKVTDNPMLPGVNGIKLHAAHLYLSNTDARTFLRAPITSSGDAVGEVETVEENLNADDFCFDAESNVYLTTHVFQSVVKLTKDGVRSRIAGGPDDAVVAGTTAAAFGRGRGDGDALYVSTTGGMSNPVAGKVGPGRVLRIEVARKSAEA